MKKEQIIKIGEEVSNSLKQKGVNFICYIWDKDGECDGGCQSVDDIDDVYVAIERLVKHFNLNADVLFETLQVAKREMAKN